MARSIFDLTERQLSTATGKITYLGEQKKPIPTVVFSPHGYPVVMQRFLEVQGSRDPYDNDKMPYTKHFNVTPAELQRMLHSLQPLLTTEDVGKGPPFLSFTLVVLEEGHVSGQEIRIAQTSGKEFYTLLIKALQPENDAGRATLSKQAVACYP